MGWFKKKKEQAKGLVKKTGKAVGSVIEDIGHETKKALHSDIGQAVATTAGAVGGFIVGGPAGAAVGAGLGSAAGGGNTTQNLLAGVGGYFGAGSSALSGAASSVGLSGAGSQAAAAAIGANMAQQAPKAIAGLTGQTALADAINNQSAAYTAQEKAAQEALVQQQAEAKAAAISRRRADLEGETKTVYTTALGDVANTVFGKTKKKTVLGG